MTKRLFLFALAAACAAALLAALAHAAADQPAVGAPAPDVKLTSNEGSPVSLKDYRGKWVVLYFYPKDFTSGCTLEAHNFQRDLQKYEQANAVILGVSVDTAESHKSFCAKEGLNFKLTMGNIITLTPALTITREEMDQALAILDRCLARVESDA